MAYWHEAAAPAHHNRLLDHSCGSVRINRWLPGMRARSKWLTEDVVLGPPLFTPGLPKAWLGS